MIENQNIHGTNRPRNRCFEVVPGWFAIENHAESIPAGEVIEKQRIRMAMLKSFSPGWSAGGRLAQPAGKWERVSVPRPVHTSPLAATLRTSKVELGLWSCRI
jgi:hypothetical protein